jgi:predicted TIM-barrel fold metal-dependent hydrolase
MTIRPGEPTTSAKIRAKLDHPVIDCDGHLREFLPIYEDYLVKHGGRKMADDYLKVLREGNKPFARPSIEERRSRQLQHQAWWGVTMADPVDFATQMAPRLLHERLDDFGVDYCILYPTLGLILNTNANPELRRASLRALNDMHADLYNKPYGDRIHVPAAVSMNTPEEAIEGLEYAVRERGFKVVQIPPGVVRPIPALAQRFPGLEAPDGVWIDRYAMDSEHDYDPVWAKFVDLGVPATSHGALMPSFPKLSRSISNYTFNHVRNQPTMMEQLCKAIYMGGVTRRFPKLNFAFMEGGVAWACNLLSDVVGHWEKRNPKALEHLNPKNLHKEAAHKLLREYGGERYDRGSAQATFEGVFYMQGDVPEQLDDFAAMKISKKEDLGELFSRFYFGCEADDRMNAHAFNTKTNRFGMKLKPLLSSDIGHFDVVHMDEVLEEAYENVEHGVISNEDFREMMFLNPVKLYGGMNPKFFEGTRVADAARRALAQG